MSDFAFNINPLNFLTDLAFGIYDRDTQKSEINRNQENVKWDHDFQKDQFNYMKQQAELMREREDNAMSRRIEDIKNAGLNPLMALGTPGAMAQIAPSGGNSGQTGSPVRVSGFQSAQLDMEIQRIKNETLVAKAQADNLDAMGRAALIQAGAATSSALASHKRIIVEDAQNWRQIEQWARENNIRQDANNVNRIIATTQQEIQRQNTFLHFNETEIEKARNNIEYQRMLIDQKTQEIENSYTQEKTERLKQEMNLETQSQVRSWIRDVIVTPLLLILLKK